MTIRIYEVWYNDPLFKDPQCEIVEALDASEAESIFMGEHQEDNSTVVDVIDITGDPEDDYD